jgi:hypothetical protein
MDPRIAMLVWLSLSRLLRLIVIVGLGKGVDFLLQWLEITICCASTAGIRNLVGGEHEDENAQADDSISLMDHCHRSIATSGT